ncbi:TIR domain-containing adapter molecule 1 [Melanotaenia boesemani]|uniref:TIR domain-containing adapter molecule 1 n=1 Tax=Melanotaenia boesemani TaxID=1250792 RepID=UPI001C04A144|nr:TIR domain-containing adapter molecule 1 [Melanotaenia boesemani]XP_041849590.1 TIR domain-containing adapter molecule 1 [Melanotaenia boesemani]
MSHVGQESQGTGLGDVFCILEKAPSERLLSLTFQLGESPEEIIIHALCLIILQRETQALNKLQMLGDNSLANYLAEKCHTSRVKLEDFGAYCCRFQAQSGESLSALAKIFKVLSEQRLCDPPLRNLAYKRALYSDCFKASNSDYLEYNQFIEEAKVVCGPHFAEWMSSIDLRSEFSSDPKKSLDEGNTTLKMSVSQYSDIQCVPSPLQESPSMSSYPTHLEISIPPTDLFQGDKVAPENPEKNPPLLVSENVSKITAGSTGSLQLQAEEGSKTDGTVATISSELKRHTLNETPTPPNNPSIEPKLAQPSATNIILPKMPSPQQMYKNKVAEEEEEETFYAFVILHAPEDTDMAESLKEEIETVIKSEGATYSEDFAIPGKSTLRCVEDAINNSAFTFLLLTRNFNSKMLEMKTNIALINSINKKHKFNTVIPLLPRENCMPRLSIPPVLQTLVPLDVNKRFDRKLQKSLSTAKIGRQRNIWTEEQTMRLNQLRMQEKEKLSHYMEQKHLLGPSVPPGQDDGDGRAWWPPQPNIHIENARYIMIGNDSKMTVDFGVNADKDGSVHTEEEH